jgi:hypothetical protein
MKKLINRNISKISLAISILFVLLLIITGYIRTKSFSLKEKALKIAPVEKLTSMPNSSSGSGLSYLIIHVSEDVHLKVTAPNGSVASEQENTMENTIYGLIKPNELKMPTTREFEQKYPQKGIYRIELKPNSLIEENVWIMSIDKNGDDFLYKDTISIDANGIVFELNNDPNDSINTSITLMQ